MFGSVKPYLNALFLRFLLPCYRAAASHQKKGKHPIQYKIGPDPSSIDSCMVGGIVANNSSGMCCGVSQNTYHTLKDMRIVFVDGTVLDTADAKVSLQTLLYSLFSTGRCPARCQGALGS